jgi:hypothetical protein
MASGEWRGRRCSVRVGAQLRCTCVQCIWCVLGCMLCGPCDCEALSCQDATSACHWQALVCKHSGCRGCHLLPNHAECMSVHVTVSGPKSLQVCTHVCVTQSSAPKYMHHTVVYPGCISTNPAQACIKPINGNILACRSCL